MKKIIAGLFILSFLYSCNNTTPVVKEMDGKQFADSVRIIGKELQVIDVRTPGEFSKGNYPNSINIDFNAPDFKDKIKNLDKKKPVYLYCLSGERSSKAAEEFKQQGFEYVVTMKGGVLALNANAGGAKSAPATNSSASQASGVSVAQYDEFIKNNKNVIVDFYADWCGPCKQMAPLIDQLHKESNGKFEILKVNIDHSRELAMKYKISSIPRLFIMKNGKQVDDIIGFDARNPEAFKQRLVKNF